jgi:D-lactate dehydrogenase (cytochrome)
LKLSPVLPSKVAVSSFPTIQDAADAVRDIVQQGVNVACVELLDDVMIKAINAKGGGIRWDEKPSLFIKFSGTEGQVKSDVERTSYVSFLSSSSYH